MERTKSIAESYPLDWPQSWPRTQEPERHGTFRKQLGREVTEIAEQVRLMGGEYLVISSNLKYRKTDGLPYANQSQPEDRGVAVYFMLDNDQVCIPCDKWDLVEHNMRAISLTIDALRGLERWGAKDMVRAAFQGFKSLPLPMIGRAPWYETLGIPRGSDEEAIRRAGRELAKKYHPDTHDGGDEAMMREVNSAVAEGLAYARARAV